MKDLFKKLKCALLGHKTKTHYDPYTYTNGYIDECLRCDKVEIKEWRR